MLNLLRRLSEKPYRVSYAQSGEDLIVDFIFTGRLPGRKPTYLDLGANDPARFNNTYFFYKQGGRGVCVEPAPAQYARLRRKRPRDVCLNVGVGPVTQASAEFHVMSNPTLSTFSREDAERYVASGACRLVNILRVPILSINDLIHTHLRAVPDFVSLDIEGPDLQVLQSLDFVRFSPAVFCVETLTYTTDTTARKKGEINEFMAAQGYFAYADTWINTIFVRSSFWNGPA